MRLSLPALAAVPVALLLAACGSSYSNSSPAATPAASATPASATVHATANSTIGTTVLVNARGLTLYRLSGERTGHFICIKGCLHLWHPLTVSAGSRPGGGVSGLGVIKRPGLGDQVTYNGMPLYTFAQDQSPGQAKGQGFKDVGTWNAVSTGGHSSTKPPASSSSSGSKYAY
ncbi:MAG: COG4315 family predicted lipoprotein [Solirubrobacteraceae bacterium]